MTPKKQQWQKKEGHSANGQLGKEAAEGGRIDRGENRHTSYIQMH